MTERSWLYRAVSGISVVVASAAAGGEGVRAAPFQWTTEALAVVRQQPDERSASVAQLPINTKVMLLARAAPWCQVEESGRRGYLKCDRLNPEALSLDKLGSSDEKEARRRAYWLAPSWGRLLAYGQLLPASMLTEAQRKAELQSHEIRRHEVPEFEAMKKRLEEGVQLQPENELAATLTPVGAAEADLPAGFLPPAKVSFFRARKEFAIAPGPDQAAALRKGVIAMKNVVDTPALVDDGGGLVVSGAWDVGKAELELRPAALFYSVAADGAVAASAISSVVADAGQHHLGCARANPMLQPEFWKAKTDQPVAGYGSVAPDAAIVRLFSAREIRPGAVGVVTRIYRQAARDRQGRAVVNPTTAHEIDLDGDGNADMVRVSNLVPANVAGDRLFKQRVRVFVNVNGIWSKELDFTEVECT